MKHKYGYFVFFITVALLISCATVSVQAGSPNITVKLKFENAKIKFGDPVIVSALIRNDGKPLRVSKGFKDMNYLLQMRVINPAGKLLLPRNYDDKKWERQLVISI